MSQTRHLPELDQLRKQVASLAQELAERDQTVRDQNRELDNELRDLREQADILRAIITGTAAETGEDFFQTLVLHLCSAFHVQYAIVGEIQGGTVKQIRTVTVSAGSTLVENFEYSLAHTPCESALRHSFACFERDVQTLFPAFERLAQLSVEGYCGVPLRAKDGTVIGLLVVMDTKPLHDTQRLKSLMTVFASRAGAELQRRQVEAKLHHQQRHLVASQALAHLGSWDWDLDSGKVWWSDEQYRLFGYEPGTVAVTQETFLQALHQDDHGRVRDAINDALTRNAGFEVECRIHRPNGEIRTVHCRGEVVRDENGRSVSLSGSMLDITDRKWMEDSVRESEERYRTLIELSPSGVFVFCEGRTVYINHTGAVLLGAADPQEILDRPMFDFIHPDYHQEVRENVKRLLGGGVSVHSAERMYVKMDGTSIPVQVEGARILWNGTPAVLGLFSDSTERKRTEKAFANLNVTLEQQVNDRTEALRRSEARFRQFFDHAPNATALKDQDGRYLYTNRRFDKVFGLASGLAIGKTDAEIFPSEQATLFQAHDRQVLTSGREQEFEEVTQQEDGAHASIVVKFPVTDTSGQPSAIGSIATDITERKRTQEQLRLYQEIFTHSIDGIAVIDLQGHYILQNRAHEQLLGYSMSELEGETPAVHLGEESFAQIGHALATTGIYRGEVESHANNGAVLKVDLTAFAVNNAEGQPVCFVGIKRDVTERNRAQEALRESQGRWKQFAESVGSAFWIAYVTPDERKVLYVNKAFTAIWGIEREEIYRNWFLWLDSVHPDDRTRVQEDHARFIAGGLTEAFDCEYRIVDRAGRIRWISDRRVKMAGWSHRVAGIAEDITHDRQRLALMAQTEAIAQIGGWELDIVTNSLWWSEETYRLHETTPKQYQPTVETALRFYTPESLRSISKALKNGTTQGTPWDLELAIISAKGRRIPVRVAGKVDVLDGRAVRAYGTFQDITDRKRAEEALRTAHDELERKVIARTAELQASQERYARATAVGKVGVWELDVVHGQYHGDANLKALFGYTSEELSTDPLAWLRLVHTDDQSIAMTHWEQLQRGAIEACHYELRMVKQDGSLVWTDVRCHSVLDLNGRLTHVIGATVDITERKQTEQALRESEERFAKAFRTSPNPIGITELATGRCIEVNDACLQLFGFHREEVIGHTTLMLGIWPHHEDRVRLIERLKAGEPVRNFELSFKTRSGELRRILVSSDLVELNGTRCLITVGSDITERKRAEEALRASEERLRLALSAAKLGLYDLDLQTGVAQVNDEYATMLGYDPSSFEETQTFWQERLHPDDRGRVDAISESYIRGHSPSYKVEARQRTKSGEWKWIASIGQIMSRDPQGRPLRMLGVYFDITERKRAEEDLRRSHRFIRQVIDTDPNFIFAKDPDGRFMLVNKAVADCYGCTVEELIGKSDADFNLNAEEVAFFRQKDREVLESLQDQFIAEEQITDYKGKRRWLQTVKRPMLDELGRAHMVLGAATDITERKAMEERLRERERELREALQERERISQDLHDGILQSLYAIGLGLEACKVLVEQPPKTTAPKLTISLNHAIGQLNHVMAEVRNFIAGLESQVMQGGDFATALRTMVQMMSSSSAARCHVRIDQEATRHISTEQALHMLNIVREGLSNAIRHSQATRITVSLRLLVRSIRLTLNDDGVGFRLDSAHGVGHGLANMEARAQKIGGLFTVRSEPQKGTKINLDIEKDGHYVYN